MIEVAVKIIFWAALPAFAIYFRIRKKIRTGFTIGIIFISLAAGLITTATVRRASGGDPVKTFVAKLNDCDYEGALRSYKIVVQYGPAYLQQIKPTDVTNPALYEQVRAAAADDYVSIANKLYSECQKGVDEKDAAADKLTHALKLLAMAESIGAPAPKLKADIQTLLGEIGAAGEKP